MVSELWCLDVELTSWRRACGVGWGEEAVGGREGSPIRGLVSHGKRNKASCQWGSEARTSQHRGSGPGLFLYWRLNAKARPPARTLLYFLCWIITNRFQATMNRVTRSPVLIQYLPVWSGLLIITFSVISATPFQYNMFQGSAYSGGEPRQRNKWVFFYYVLCVLVLCVLHKYKYHIINKRVLYMCHLNCRALRVRTILVENDNYWVLLTVI